MFEYYLIARITYVDFCRIRVTHVKLKWNTGQNKLICLLQCTLY